MDAVVASLLAAMIGLYGTTIAILISHERRLTRIEAKLDVLIRYLNDRKE